MSNVTGLTQLINSSTYRASATSDGLIRGIVVENRDPLLLGRLQIQVPAMTGAGKGGMNGSDLPWAMPCVPYGGPGYGSVLIPEVGTTVWVLFEGSDKSKPVWIGCSYGAVGNDANRQLRSESENTFQYSKNYYHYPTYLPDTPSEYVFNKGDVKVLYRSPKGMSILNGEADEDEFFKVIDRSGQTFIMYSPVRKDYNEDNQSSRTWGDVFENNLNDRITDAMIDEAFIAMQHHSQKDESFDSYFQLWTENCQLTNGRMQLRGYGDDDNKGKRMFLGDLYGETFVDIDKYNEQISIEFYQKQVLEDDYRERIRKGEKPEEIVPNEYWKLRSINVSPDAVFIKNWTKDKETLEMQHELDLVASDTGLSISIDGATVFSVGATGVDIDGQLGVTKDASVGGNMGVTGNVAGSDFSGNNFNGNHSGNWGGTGTPNGN